MKRTLSFLLPAAAMLLAACGGANDRPSFPDFQEMADPAAAFADWSAAGDTPCASFVTTDRRFGKSQLPDVADGVPPDGMARRTGVGAAARMECAARGAARLHGRGADLR